MRMLFSSSAEEEAETVGGSGETVKRIFPATLGIGTVSQFPQCRHEKGSGRWPVPVRVLPNMCLLQHVCVLTVVEWTLS